MDQKAQKDSGGGPEAGAQVKPAARGKAAPLNAREVRLKAALKANMARRKAQARGRAADSASGDVTDEGGDLPDEGGPAG